MRRRGQQGDRVLLVELPREVDMGKGDQEMVGPLEVLLILALIDHLTLHQQALVFRDRLR